MLGRLFLAEWLKLRRSALWLAVVILPLIAAVMGSFNYWQNRGILTQEWYSLWTQFTLFYCFVFFPALIGIYCAYLCRLEHTNHNWNLTLALPITPAALYITKLAVAAVLALITQLLLLALFVIVGMVMGFSNPLPPEVFSWVLRGWLAAVVIAAVMLTVALMTPSFALAVGVSIAGAVLGLLTFSKGWGLYCPFGLLSLGMNANKPNQALLWSDHLTFLLAAALYLILAAMVGCAYLRKRDKG